MCSGGCSTRLGVESPIGHTNNDVLDHLLTAHLLIDKPRMPGALVSSAVLSRVAEQAWPQVATEAAEAADTSAV
eukprot:COSAG06_NODE_24864_length_650_cov_1.344828_2_plen_74_part_00